MTTQHVTAVRNAPPRPGSLAPALAVNLVDGGQWVLAEQTPANFTMLVFYRGLHCPACRRQLAALQHSRDELSRLGVQPIAVSADTEQRARRARTEWELSNLLIGYELPMSVMRTWGLFVSTSINEEEPEYFNEPATFLIDRDERIYYAALTSMPFGRPQLDELLGGIDFVTRTSYPGRGGREGVEKDTMAWTAVTGAVPKTQPSHSSQAAWVSMASRS